MGRSSDFKFWEERLSVGCRGCGDELFEFQMRREDQVEASSPTLWRRPKTSTLLPDNHQYSCLSPTSRLRAIVDGRRELMEMLKDIPESSYELYLSVQRGRRRPSRESTQERDQREEIQIKRTERVPVLEKFEELQKLIMQIKHNKELIYEMLQIQMLKSQVSACLKPSQLKAEFIFSHKYCTGSC